MTDRVALFPGTFDPVTRGHVDVVRRGAALFDRLVVAVAAGGKSTWFPVEERVALVRTAVGDVRNVEVVPFDGLLVEFARRHGARALLRGVRTYQDWEYELRMLQMNRHLAPELETVFLAPAVEWAFVSSTLVREVSALGGDLTDLVPPAVAAALARRRPAGAR
ncbi:MAG: pantetheine-phosphate adenylyltransferase [Planctomycetota bacterium]